MNELKNADELQNLTKNSPVNQRVWFRKIWKV